MNNGRGSQKEERFTCEITCNGNVVLPLKRFTTLKEIAKECEMSYYQICDLYEGRV